MIVSNINGVTDLEKLRKLFNELQIVHTHRPIRKREIAWLKDNRRMSPEKIEDISSVISLVDEILVFDNEGKYMGTGVPDSKFVEKEN